MQWPFAGDKVCKQLPIYRMQFTTLSPWLPSIYRSNQIVCPNEDSGISCGSCGRCGRCGLIPISFVSERRQHTSFVVNYYLWRFYSMFSYRYTAQHFPHLFGRMQCATSCILFVSTSGIGLERTVTVEPPSIGCSRVARRIDQTFIIL